MKSYTVVLRLNSYYEDSQYDLEKYVREYVEVESLEVLVESLDNGEGFDSIDDACIINFDTDEMPDESTIGYDRIIDKEGTVVYKNPDLEDEEC
jgi:hypothetical protein